MTATLQESGLERTRSGALYRIERSCRKIASIETPIRTDTFVHLDSSY
jgi:hypothetical protein